LFLDATQRSGGLAWLHPGAQDQDALVVRGGGAVLVHTPTRQQRERVRLAVDLAPDAQGRLVGKVHMELVGAAGDALAGLAAVGKSDAVERAVRRAIERYLPGVEIDVPRWTIDEAPTPTAVVDADVRLSPAPETPGTGGWPAFSVPPLTVMPPLAVLDDRELPVVASPFVEELSWTVALGADACPPAGGQDVGVSNSLGSFRQRVALDGTRLTVARRSELAKRWLEPSDFPLLRELALAEARTGKRHLRWECR
jgi:hypothetical protein